MMETNVKMFSIIDFSACVILPAGGSGVRFAGDANADMPKQYSNILGNPIMSYTIEAFHRLSWVSDIIITVSSSHIDHVTSLCKHYGFQKVLVVEGGLTRHRSIYNGIKAMPTVLTSPDIVLIHDVVRPLAEEPIVREVARAAKEHGAAGVTRPLVSTVIGIDSDSFLSESLDRAKYRASEMPQGFQYNVILKAYQQCSEHDLDYGTECLHLAQKYANTTVKLVEGNESLWKVTYKKDLYAAQGMIREQCHRVSLLGDMDAALRSAMCKALRIKSLQVVTMAMPSDLDTHGVTTCIDFHKTFDKSEIVSRTVLLRNAFRPCSVFHCSHATIVIVISSVEEFIGIYHYNVFRHLSEIVQSCKDDGVYVYIILAKTESGKCVNSASVSDGIASLIWERNESFVGQVFCF